MKPGDVAFHAMTSAIACVIAIPLLHSMNVQYQDIGFALIIGFPLSWYLTWRLESAKVPSRDE